MERDPLQANSCTVELTTGSLIEVAQAPKDVLFERERLMTHQASGGGGLVPVIDMMELVPLIGSQRSDAEYREKVWVDPRHIVAIYPLDERPLPPRRVYVDRIEAHSK